MALIEGTYGSFSQGCAVISLEEYNYLLACKEKLKELRTQLIDEIAEIDSVVSIDVGA